MDQDFFLRLSSSIWAQGIVLVSSITFFNTICFAIALTIWATNRQTQIRPKSQKREESSRRLYVSFKDQQSLKESECHDDDNDDDNSNESESPLLRPRSGSDSYLFSDRRTMIRNQSLDFSAAFTLDEDEDFENSDEELSNNDFDKEAEYGDKFDGIDLGEDTVCDDTAAGMNAPLQNLHTSIKQDMMIFLSTMNVFSYLSDDAFKELLKDMRYIDLPLAGSPIRFQSTESDSKNISPVNVDESILDGSFYIVVSGNVRCSCQFEDAEMAELYKTYRPSSLSSSSHDQTKLQITVGPGDLVTSQLAMLSDLICWYQERNGTYDKSLMSAHPVKVHACTAEHNTCLICVPSISFLSILEKFPHEVHQIAQTILARTQRVIMQTLVKSLGLINEVIPQKQGSQSNFCQDGSVSNDWDEKMKESQLQCQAVFSDGSSHQDVTSIEVSDEVKHNIAMRAAFKLGTTKHKDIELIKINSSIIAVSPGVPFVHAGTKSKYIYFVIGGELELGNFLTSMGEKGLESSLQSPLGLWTKTSSLMNPNDFDQDDKVSFQVAQNLNPGAITSELSAFAGEVSMVTIRGSARSNLPSYLLRISTEAYLSLLTSNTSVLIHSIGSILRNNFSPVVHLLDWGLRWRDLQAPSTLIRKGEPCQSLFVVLNGRLRSADYNEHKTEVENEYGRGSCIGEVQIMNGDLWTHDVFAIRNSQLAEIPVNALEFIMSIFPSCGVHFARVIANHVQQKYVKKDSFNVANSDNRLPSYKLSVATITIVPLCFGLKDDYSSIFCKNVLTALQKIAPSILITKDWMKQKLGKIDNIKNFNDVLKLARILGDLEENNRLVVFQAESNLNWWSKTCIEHSDCVVLVLDSQKAPLKCNNVTKYLSKIQGHKGFMKRVDLVLMTEEEDDADLSISDDFQCVSLETHEWIESLPFETNINLISMVRMMSENQDKDDVNRMCRRITGCSLGLVLGGGGARGIAHLGVIKALLDAGVSVDIVGGTSQGAFIGALFAKYPDKFYKLMKSARVMGNRMSSVKDKILDLTLPLVSYFDGRRFNKCISDVIGNHTQIQYLPNKFFCVSTDLCNYCQAIHTTGCCWKFVRASMSLHGYLPPIAENGKLLLDGGYMSICPIDVMIKKFRPRAVIAVDVSLEDAPKYYEYGSYLSGFWLLWNSWNPFVRTERIPSMGELSARLIWVNAVKQQQKIEDNCDLFLAPPVHEYSTLDYHMFDEIYQLGYEYARPRVKAFINRQEYEWVIPK